jgi:beta-phosphoglucomutase
MASLTFSADTVFIFDFDGTIADSLPLHEAAFQDVIAAEMPQLSFSYAAHTGKDTVSVFRDIGVPPDTARQLAGQKRARYEARVRGGELRFMPGADAALALFSTLPCRRFIGTSGSRGSVSEALRALGLTSFFEGIVTSSDVTTGKPSPEIFLKIARDFGVEPARCIVIEDAPSGVIAARAAGMPVVGVYHDGLAGNTDAYFARLDLLAQHVINTMPLVAGKGGPNA